MKRSTVERFSYVNTLYSYRACAKISNPSGGPRDRTPPVVIETVPEYGAKNFRGKRFLSHLMNMLLSII